MRNLLIILISFSIISTLFSQENSMDSLLYRNKAPLSLPLQASIEHYDCVNYCANRLLFPNDSSKFELLYKQLDSLSVFGKGDINIIHIGGSHVQADVFTNQLRTNFANIQESFVANRGVIFPYSVAKTNNPKNYSISHEGTWTKTQNSRPPISNELGITGYSITTNNSYSTISFDLNPHKNTNWQYNHLRLLYSIDNDYYEPFLVVGHDTIAGTKDNDAIVFELNSYKSKGKIILDLNSKHNYYYNKYHNELPISTDSIEEEFFFTNDANITDSLNISLESDKGTIDTITINIDNTSSLIQNIPDTDSIFSKESDNINFTIYGLLPTTDFNGITIHSLGVNGASLKSWLRCSLFEEQLKYIHPDLALLNVGINDANVPSSEFNIEAFKNKYNELIQQLYSNNPECAIIFITNNDCILRIGRRTRYTNPNGKLVQKAIYELAEEHNAAVWDLYDIMGGYGSSKVWQNNGLINKDRIHFTITGYKLLGNLLYNSIIYDWMYKE